MSAIIRGSRMPAMLMARQPVLPGPFELDAIGRRGPVAAPLHFDPAVAQLGEDAVFEVQHAARTGKMIGIGFFVERVGGGRLRG